MASFVCASKNKKFIATACRHKPAGPATNVLPRQPIDPSGAIFPVVMTLLSCPPLPGIMYDRKKPKCTAHEEILVPARARMRDQSLSDLMSQAAVSTPAAQIAYDSTSAHSRRSSRWQGGDRHIQMFLGKKRDGLETALGQARSKIGDGLAVLDEFMALRSTKKFRQTSITKGLTASGCKLEWRVVAAGYGMLIALKFLILPPSRRCSLHTKKGGAESTPFSSIYPRLSRDSPRTGTG